MEASRRALATPARLALAGALSLALAALLFTPPELARLESPPCTVLVLDASGSAVRTRAGWDGWVRARLAEHARRARAAGAELALVRCARGVELLLGPARLEPEALAAAAWGPQGRARGDDAGTDLAGAVHLAEDLLAGRRAGTLVLLGDGTFTGADPRPGLRRLARRGMALERESPPAPDRPDVALADLRLARALEPGAPLVAEVLLVARGGPAPPGARVELELELSGPDGARRVRASAAFPPGAGAVERLDLGRAGSGRTEVRAGARLVAPGSEGDAVPENDFAQAVIEVGETLIVAALAPRPAGAPEPEREDWETWCAGLERLGGLQVLHARPEDFAALPGAVDVVVSLDLPLAAARALGLADFVAGGGGWLAMGGYPLFAGQGPESIGPLRAAQGPARVVLVLADGSGSMSGAPFDELSGALLAAMEVAPASDHFELCTFTDVVESRHLLGPGGPDTARAASALLAARAPRGATDVLAALREVAGRAELPGLLLLLTDGRDQPPAVELGRGAEALRRTLERGGTRLVVVGVGPAQDTAALEALAGPTTLRRADEGLARVLREELGLGRFTPRGRHALTAADPAALETRDALAAALAAALGSAPLPPLERLQRARLTPGAEALLEGSAGPALALGRHGRGRVAALASAPVRGFGGEWSGRPELLGPLVRALGRAGQRELPALRPGWGPEGARLTLGGVPPDWPAVVRACFADGSSARLTPPVEVPGADPGGYRRGSWARPSAAPGRVTLRSEAGPGPGEVLGTAPDPGTRAVEFSPGAPALGALPRARAAPDALGPGAGSGHPAAPWFLGLGLGLVSLAAALGWDRASGAASGPGAPGR